MVPGRHAGQLLHLSWMTCINKEQAPLRLTLTVSVQWCKHPQQCYWFMCLTGQTGLAWFPKMPAAWHSRHYWPTDPPGQCSWDWTRWPPSLPGLHTLGWWMHSVCKHQHIVHRLMLKTLKSCIESVQCTVCVVVYLLHQTVQVSLCARHRDDLCPAACQSQSCGPADPCRTKNAWLQIHGHQQQHLCNTRVTKGELETVISEHFPPVNRAH